MKPKICQNQGNRFSYLKKGSIIVLILTCLVFNIGKANDEIYTKAGKKIICKISSIDSSKITVEFNKEGNKYTSFIPKDQVSFYKLNVKNFVSTLSTQDVIYHKNGNIIQGIIIEQIPNQNVKILTRDGNVFVYDVADIEKIIKVQIKEGDYNDENQSDFSYTKKLKPVSAFIWSFILPGGGQFYNGQYAKGCLLLGLYIGGWIGVNAALKEYSKHNINGYQLETWDGEKLYYVSIDVIAACAIWSMIDAPISARAKNKLNGLSLNYKLNRNADLALKPDYKLDCFGGKINPIYGVKMSFNLH